MQECPQSQSLTHKKRPFLRRFHHVSSLLRVKMHDDVVDLEYDIVELVVCRLYLAFQIRVLKLEIAQGMFKSPRCGLVVITCKKIHTRKSQELSIQMLAVHLHITAVQSIFKAGFLREHLVRRHLCLRIHVKEITTRHNKGATKCVYDQIYILHGDVD